MVKLKNLFCIFYGRKYTVQSKTNLPLVNLKYTFISIHGKKSTFLSNCPYLNGKNKIRYMFSFAVTNCSFWTIHIKMVRIQSWRQSLFLFKVAFFVYQKNLRASKKGTTVLREGSPPTVLGGVYCTIKWLVKDYFCNTRY